MVNIIENSKLEPYLHYIDKYEYRIFYSEEDEGYICTVVEIPNCSAFGDTIEESIQEIKDAIYATLDYFLEANIEIPVPLCLKDYSGRFSIRISPNLHYKITKESKIQGISINTLLSNIISKNL